MRNAGGIVWIYTQKQTFRKLSAIAVPHPSFVLALTGQGQNPPSPRGKVFPLSALNSNLCQCEKGFDFGAGGFDSALKGKIFAAAASVQCFNGFCA